MAKSKSKRRAVKEKARGAAGAQPGGGMSSDVERRWQEYWRRRQELESAIAQVKDAQAALDSAKEAEGALRVAFDETKRSLKSLLDVEPADGGETGASSGVEELN